MTRTNYVKEFSKSIVIKIITPIYSVLLGIMILFEILAEEFNVVNCIAIFATFLVCWLLTFVVFYIVGSILYKKMQIQFKDDIYYQGKRKIKKEELMYVNVSKIRNIYCIRLFKDKNHILIDYFLNFEELREFVLEYNLLFYLDGVTKLSFIHIDENTINNSSFIQNEKVDILWNMYGEGKLEGDIFYLLDYIGMINGEGHNCFLSNIETSINEYDESLKRQLPTNFYRAFKDAVNAYVDDIEVTKFCDIADKYFYKHEEILLKMVEDYANEYISLDSTLLN